MALGRIARGVIMRYVASIWLGLGLILISAPGRAQEKGEIKLEVVKYDGLKDAVLRNRGKVVLVDFWGEF